ncbi:hypothetical protein [Achromobacter xylosoxidans]|uniref:hypothetical protein n=1 Tax=Alcaligenes xylosoxydans xylosoxydans TaxID=85698 RepID=UPI0022B93C80|nr:hypothetical protein [Achromobacter xylosoxidans]MCZ8388730.1 hypothetical protein [Achromobacter xylosoxidans]WOB70839.1 hypothetical protein PZA07_16195 [Achromobacter xylosoxidans]
MTRYRALRLLGCGWFTAGIVAGVNRILGVPSNEVRFMNVVIEINGWGSPLSAVENDRLKEKSS